jgi:hypothetical protein
MLPIHIAIKKHVEPSVINALIKSYPGSLEVLSDDIGMTPLQMASMSGSIHRNYYLRALSKDSETHRAIIGDPLSDLLCGFDYKSFPGKGLSLIIPRLVHIVAFQKDPRS